MPSMFRKGASMEFLSPSQARAFRQRLYAYREALRAHPDYDLKLLLLANATSIRVHGKTVRTTHHVA